MFRQGVVGFVLVGAVRRGLFWQAWQGNFRVSCVKLWLVESRQGSVWQAR